jgi:hypothetical protein
MLGIEWCEYLRRQVYMVVLDSSVICTCKCADKRNYRAKLINWKGRGGREGGRVDEGEEGRGGRGEGRDRKGQRESTNEEGKR